MWPRIYCEIMYVGRNIAQRRDERLNVFIFSLTDIFVCWFTFKEINGAVLIPWPDLKFERNISNEFSLYFNQEWYAISSTFYRIRLNWNQNPSGLIQARAPHLFLQHFKFPLQSPSKEHLLLHIQGPEGLWGQNPGFSIYVNETFFYIVI